jgi:hypothetical protein
MNTAAKGPPEPPRFHIFFCGGPMDGQHSTHPALPECIAVVTEDDSGCSVETSYRPAGTVANGELTIYEVDTGLH